MPLDPLELKILTAKRELQVKQVQKYIEEQDELDKGDAAGKLGSYTVKNISAENVPNIPFLAKNLLNKDPKKDINI